MADKAFDMEIGLGMEYDPSRATASRVLTHPSGGCGSDGGSGYFTPGTSFQCCARYLMLIDDFRLTIFHSYGSYSSSI